MDAPIVGLEERFFLKQFHAAHDTLYFNVSILSTV